MSKSNRAADQEGSSRGDETMRESFHFTHMMGSTDISVNTKLEEYDEVESEEKVGGCSVWLGLKLLQ